MSESTTAAPDHRKYRTVVNATDSGPFNDKKQGLNAGHYRRLNVNVIPTSGANPTVEVMFWSDEASAFVSENPALTKAGAGVNTAYAFTVEANGRMVFIAVTAGLAAAQQVVIETSGYGLDHTL